MNLSTKKLEKLETILTQNSEIDFNQILNEYSLGYFKVIVPRIEKPLLKRYHHLLDLSLEIDSPIFEILIQYFFNKKNLHDLPNALFFIKYILSGPVLKEIRKSANLSWIILESSSAVIKNFKELNQRYLFADDVDKKILKSGENNQICSMLPGEDIYEFREIDRYNLFSKYQTLKDFNMIEECWNASYNLHKSAHRIAMLIIQNAMKDNSGLDDNSASNLNLFRFSVNLYFEEAFNFFVCSFDSKENKYREICHQIIWLLLKYLSENSKFEIFREYSLVPPELINILNRYILLNPKEHLDLIKFYHREYEYSKFIKYGLEYKGYELSGGGGSGDGINIKLRDIPIVNLIFEPVLDQLYKKAHQENTIPDFVFFLDQNFIKISDEISSSNPLILRRSSIKILIQILKDASFNATKIFEILKSYIKSKRGIPALGPKCFYEFLKFKDDKTFYKQYGLKIIDLIKRDIELSFSQTPNEFSFRVLIILCKYNIKGSKQLLRDLFSNNNFLKQDSFYYSILANIEKELGVNSDELSYAIEIFYKSTQWKSNHGSYSYQVISRYIVSKNNLLNHIEKLIRSSDEGLIEIAINVLRTISDEDPNKSIKLINNLLKGRKPYQVFFNTEFLPAILKKYFNGLSKNNWQGIDEVSGLALELCKYLINDPNPETPDQFHNDILEGGDGSTFSTTRGYLAYVIRHLSCSKEFFPLSWDLTKHLLNDENKNVVHEAFYSFYEILRRRQWDKKIKEDAIKTLWDFFNEKESPKAIEKQMLSCFHVVRDLNEQEAIKVLTRFSNIKTVETLFVFYAIYRKQIRQWDKFNNDQFLILLEKRIRSGSLVTKRKILSVFVDCISDDNNIFRTLYPFLKIYARGGLIDNHSFSQFVRIFEMLIIKNTEVKNKREIIYLFKTVFDSVIEYSKTANERLDSYFGKELFIKIYSLSKKDFYIILNKIEKLLFSDVFDLWTFSREDILKIIMQEKESDYFNSISNFINVYVAKHPEDYKLKSQWLNSVT